MKSNSLSILSIVSFLALIFWGGKQFTYGGGDDVFLITDEFIKPYLNSLYNFKFYEIIQNRKMLHITYAGVYKMFNESLVLASWFFVSFYIASGFLLYSTLKNHVSKSSALIASLFFISYTGKYEIIGQYQGQLYHAVIFAMICIIHCFLKYQNHPAKRFVSCAVILWASLLLYEILIILAPIFTVAIAYEYFLKNKKIDLLFFKSKQFLYSFIPTFVATIHITIIALAQNPIWNRIQTEDTSLVARISKVPRVFRWGLEAILGPDYFAATSKGLISFFRDTLFHNTGYVLLVLPVVVFLFIISTRAKLEKVSTRSSYSNNLILFLLLAAAISPLVALTTADGFVSSRFSYTPSVFLSIALALITEKLLSKKTIKHTIALNFIYIFIFLQTLSLSGILAQYGRAGDLDEKIHNAIVAKLPRLENGDGIIVSIPYNAKAPYWTPYRVIGARYHVSPTASFLWGLNSHMNIDVPNKGIPRKPGWEQRMLNHFKSKVEKISNQYCIQINNNYEANIANNVVFSSNNKNISFHCKKMKEGTQKWEIPLNKTNL